MSTALPLAASLANTVTRNYVVDKQDADICPEKLRRLAAVGSFSFRRRGSFLSPIQREALYRSDSM